MIKQQATNPSSVKAKLEVFTPDSQAAKSLPSSSPDVAERVELARRPVLPRRGYVGALEPEEIEEEDEDDDDDDEEDDDDFVDVVVVVAAVVAVESLAIPESECVGDFGCVVDTEADDKCRRTFGGRRGVVAEASVRITSSSSLFFVVPR